MAVTKIKPIRGTVNKALAYILDPQKTDDAFYVSSYGCAASDAAAKEFEWTRNLAIQQGMQMPKVIARHLIQSFAIDEVTPEQAHEIGKQFADEWLKGKYEYVIATHIDKGHCHNHIIFNAVNYVDFHAYRSNKKTYREMRHLSDEICAEHGLSVIPPSQGKGMDYKEYTEAKRGTSWKQKLKQTIDRCVITAKDYDEFLKLMQDAGYEIKTGKYISFRAEGQERFTRAKTIGDNYTEDRIKERIQGRNARRRQMQNGRKNISLISDIQNRIKQIDSKGFELVANFNSVSGLRVGADVEMAGVPVGRVASIKLDDDLSRRQARVVLILDKDLQLPADTIASVKTSGLIGDKYVNLTAGGSEDILASGDTLEETESAVDIESLISKYALGGV